MHLLLETEALVKMQEICTLPNSPIGEANAAFVRWLAPIWHGNVN
jgi:hypothetical protein